MGEINKKAGVYVRVSTEEQAKEGISIDAQIDRCTAFCKARGWDVFQVYTDAGYSAGSTNRPALQRLLEDARNQKIQILLVYKIDRFSRHLKDLISILEELKKMQVNFTSVTEQIDTTTAMGEAFFQIIGVFAQLERGMVKERVEMAFEKKIKSGEALNRPPFGYTYKNRKLVPHPEEAEKVREIFSLWAAGVHYKAIAEKSGLPVSTLYELVKNPTYIGKVLFRGQLYPGTHKSLVDTETFDRVQNSFRLNNNCGD